MIKILFSIIAFSTLVHAKDSSLPTNMQIKNEPQQVSDSHAKKEEHEHEHEEGAKDHVEEEGHEDHEEENSKIGPEKGILEVNEESGFKLSPEALKNFEIKTQKLSSQGPWELPLSARLLSQEEVNLFRVREGFFKRIDFNLLSKSQTTMKITSADLKDGDEIVINGIGFLRIAEITASGGAPEGHSH